MENPYLLHLPKERKIKKAESRLMDGYLSLLEKGYRFDGISITEVCAQAQVSRTSFYSHFKRPIDVLRAIEDTIIVNCYRRLIPVFDQSYSLDARHIALDQYLDYMLSKKKAIRCLLGSSMPALTFVEKYKMIVKANLYPTYALKKENDIYLESAAAGIVSPVLYYVQHDEEFDKNSVKNAILEIYHLFSNQ